MKIFVSIHTKDMLVYYKIGKYKHGRGISRIHYIYWNFNNSVEKRETYVGTTTEINQLLKFIEDYN